jgi:phosphate transport system ATP-binding protein
VPQAIREAAYGSESTLAYHAFHHLGPTSGAVTGVMLAFARVAEERRHYIVYGLRKPVLELEIGSTHGRLVITDFHLRHFALRRVAPAGVGWCIGFDRSDRGCGRGGSPCGEARDIGGSVTVMGVGITVEHVNAFYGKTQALFDINLIFQANHATALIGPSGCGKSTFIRCLNRMHETIPDARVEGTVRIGDLSVYNGTSATQLRRRVGMVFQKANPFPTMSIYDNVASGLKLNGFRNRKQLDEVVERSLNSAALWDEVKDHLHKKSGASLSGGQQQRLCIARALADQPEVLLMDDHSALGPISTN